MILACWGIDAMHASYGKVALLVASASVSQATQSCDPGCLCCSLTQGCYGIEAVPEGEWLCWPCTDYEASLRKQGQSQAVIRPPRWQRGGDSAPPLPGGSSSVTCALCPVTSGAFKQASDGSGRWVHCVCALWHPDTKLSQSEFLCMWCGGVGVFV